MMWWAWLLWCQCPWSPVCAMVLGTGTISVLGLCVVIPAPSTYGVTHSFDHLSVFTQTPPASPPLVYRADLHQPTVRQTALQAVGWLVIWLTSRTSECPCWWSTPSYSNLTYYRAIYCGISATHSPRNAASWPHSTISASRQSIGTWRPSKQVTLGLFFNTLKSQIPWSRLDFNIFCRK